VRPGPLTGNGSFAPRLTTRRANERIVPRSRGGGSAFISRFSRYLPKLQRPCASRVRQWILASLDDPSGTSSRHSPTFPDRSEFRLDSTVGSWSVSTLRTRWQPDPKGRSDGTARVSKTNAIGGAASCETNPISGPRAKRTQWQAVAIIGRTKRAKRRDETNPMASCTDYRAHEVSEVSRRNEPNGKLYRLSGARSE
jgi:hypothetical protein